MNLLKKYKLRREQNFFDMVPVQNFQYEMKDENLAVVLIPRFDKNPIGRFLERRSSKKEIRAELDEIGTTVWLAIDGKATVFDIAKILRAQMGVIEQADNRTVEYLKQLYHHSFIDFKEYNKKL